MNTKTKRRPDHEGPQRHQYEQNRKIIFATQTVCAICGQPVDFSLKFPDPMSATCDHIIPLDRGGDPSSLDNLQLAHLRCNRAKSDSLMVKSFSASGNEAVSNRDLPQHCDWINYKYKN